MMGQTWGRWLRRSVVALASILGGSVGFLLGVLLAVYTGGCYQDGFWKTSCTGSLVGMVIIGVTTGAVAFGFTASKITRRHAPRDPSREPG